MAAIRANVKLDAPPDDWRDWLRRGSVVGLVVAIIAASAVVTLIALGVVMRVIVEFVRAGYLMFGMW